MFWSSEFFWWRACEQRLEDHWIMGGSGCRARRRRHPPGPLSPLSGPWPTWAEGSVCRSILPHGIALPSAANFLFKRIIIVKTTTTTSVCYCHKYIASKNKPGKCVLLHSVAYGNKHLCQVMSVWVGRWFCLSCPCSAGLTHAFIVPGWACRSSTWSPIL